MSWFGTVSGQLSRLGELIRIPPEDADEKPATSTSEKLDSGKEPEQESRQEPQGGDVSEEVSEKKSAAEPLFPSTLSMDNIKGVFSKLSVDAKNTVSKVAAVAGDIKQRVGENTILGDFEHEQEEFIRSKQSGDDVAALPWTNCADESALRKQIFALSLDPRNFLRDPPVGTSFQFNLATSQPVAVAMLGEDPNLAKMRYALVPKEIKEEAFWRNYFYRVSLVTQSMQLKSMNANPAAVEKPSPEPRIQEDRPSTSSTAELVDDSPSLMTEDFLSDDVQQEVNEAELRQVRDALGLGMPSNRNPQSDDGFSTPPPSFDSGTATSPLNHSVSGQTPPGETSLERDLKTAQQPQTEGGPPGEPQNDASQGPLIGGLDDSQKEGPGGPIPHDGHPQSSANEDWEQELVAELADFELVKDQTRSSQTGSGGSNATTDKDEEWEKEIASLLEAEANDESKN